MGTPIPIIEYGNDCLACWNAGETPKFVYIMFDGVKPGYVGIPKQVPNGHLFKCEQDPLNACRYLYGTGGPGWVLDFYRMSPSEKWRVSLSFWLGSTYFSGTIDDCPYEHAIFENLLDDPYLYSSWDGVAAIIWMGKANELLELLVIPSEETLMEFFLIDELKPVYKFCNVKLSVNQCIEVE